MHPENPPDSDLRSLLLNRSHAFLSHLEEGAPNEILLSELFQIKLLESEMMRLQKIQLHPVVWKMLVTRYHKRIGREISDV